MSVSKAPRITVAAMRGGEGKTMVAVGLAAAWRKSGLRVAAFKKGPDYIDAAWLTAASGGPCRNLDSFIMPAEAILRSFAANTASADIALVEGNRGLFDGADAAGTYSTAELAKCLQSPVLLIADATKSTRTVAATILGCQRLDPKVLLGGVILNRVANRRQEALLKECVAQICGIPVLGVIPRLAQMPFPERHLGLFPPQEHDAADSAVMEAARVVEKHLDLNEIRRVADSAPRDSESNKVGPVAPAPQSKVRIGIFRDKAFQFYYAENMEALTAAGAQLIDISPISDSQMPQVDALYIGGGFPETQAKELASNSRFRASLRAGIEQGLPIYAECGGAVYLGEELHKEDQVFPMVGALPVAFGFGRKPQAHGYAVLEAVAENPFYSVGQVIRGHEFHYTYMLPGREADLTFAFRVKRGYGFGGQQDGLCCRNVLACYTHIHALGLESWAPALVRQASRFRNETSQPAGCGEAVL